MSILKAKFFELGDIRLVETERRALRPTDVRVRTILAGMNPGTYLAFFSGEHARLRDDYVPLRHPRAVGRDLPWTFGGYGVGTVIEIGSEVQGVEEGDLVQGFMEYSPEPVLDAQRLRKVPPGTDLEECAMMEQAMVALNAIRRSRLSFGDNVVVIGQGPIGLGVTQMVHLAGANVVIATDLYENRLAVARELGADHAVSLVGEDLVRFVFSSLGMELMEQGLGERDGVDIAFDCAGVSEAVWAGLKLVRHAGTICVVAMHRRPLEAVSLGTDFHLREIEIVSAQKFGRANTWPWTADRNWDFYLTLMAQHKLRLSKMISHRIPFEELPESRIYQLLFEKPEEAIFGLITFEHQQ